MGVILPNKMNFIKITRISTNTKPLSFSARKGQPRMDTRIRSVIVWTIAVCLGWYILALVQGHGGCLMHPPFSPPPNARDRALLLREVNQQYENICHGPRLFFEWEIGATLLAGIIVVALTAKNRRGASLA